MSPYDGQMPATETGKTATASGSELGTGRSFSSVAVTLPTGSANPGNEAQTTMMLIPVESLHANPLQLRQHIGEEGIEALACSIAENGPLQPIIVRENSNQHATSRSWPASVVGARPCEPAVDPILSALFGHKVTVSYHGQRGMLTIHFNGLEGLSRLVKRLKAALTGRAGPAKVGAGSHSKAETRRTRDSQEVGADPSVKENPGSVRDQLHKLAINYDLSRPIRLNEKAYGPKPEPLSKKPSAHAVSDSPPRATRPIRVDQP